MVTISLCMIVRNEEEVLARCLESVKGIADEIIIVDTGSTDATIEIAKRYTENIYDFEWIDDFAAARNYSFSKATKDYILWLDADDIIDDANREKFIALKNNFPNDVDVAMLKYNTAFDQNGNCTFSYYRERLVRRSMGYIWNEPVHEHIIIVGSTREFDIAITHGDKHREGLSRRNLEIYQKLEESGKALSTRALYYYARELKTHGHFEAALERYKRFFEAGNGWNEDRITAARNVSECLFRLDRREEAKEALCKSLGYDIPRAETCCMLAELYVMDEAYDKAIFWYNLVLSLPRPSGWGFVEEDMWGFIPHMQLCMLYDKKGEREKAIKHHEAAKRLKPESPLVLYNEQYFSQV